MFDLDGFVDACRAAVAKDSSFETLQEIVTRAVSDPSAVIDRFGKPRRAKVESLYHAPDLNILNFVWGPQMTLLPHNHRMRVVIGIYTGREDNIFWQRVPGNEGGKIEPIGVTCLRPGEAIILQEDIIHSVTNPLMRPTGAFHVYGGDFYGMRRSEWDPETLLERAFNLDAEMKWFEEMNAIWASSRQNDGAI